jgi:hypothetical protein
VEGFKPNVKMKSDISCYKEGGYVSRKKHSEEKEEAKDIAKDKSMIKKAVGQHEGAKHKGEGKTELKLKTGRRVKKTGGVVNKYKTGGLCNPMKDGGAISMKMDKEDRKKVAEVKKTKAAKASAPSAAAKKSKEPIGYADGSSVGSMRAGRQDDMSTLLEDAAKAVQGSQGGMGAAAATGGMGNAYPMGAEEDLMRGLTAVGRAMGGRI